VKKGGAAFAAINAVRLAGTLLALAIFGAAPSFASGPARAAEPSNDLVNAFTTTYRHAPPLIMQIKERLGESEQTDHPDDLRNVTMSITPNRLIQLHGSKYALFVFERDQDASYADPGAISIAYLDDNNGSWKLDHLWPEIAFMGNSGQPADKLTKEAFRSEPLVLASTTYCGMGSCSEDIVVFGLDKNAPRNFGDVPGSAEFQSDFPNSSCESYHYVAALAAPVSAKNLMSVTYSGWTAAPGKSQPRRMFRIATDYSISGSQLVPQPAIKIPDCGK